MAGLDADRYVLGFEEIDSTQTAAVEACEGVMPIQRGRLDRWLAGHGGSLARVARSKTVMISRE